MTTRACPDWPELMELAPDLHFKHYTAAEAHLPAEALVNVPVEQLAEANVCADLEHHVFYAAHTEPAIGEGLRGSHWFELGEWSLGPGAAA
jgi:hypothetical protein